MDPKKYFVPSLIVAIVLFFVINTVYIFQNNNLIRQVKILQAEKALMSKQIADLNRLMEVQDDAVSEWKTYKNEKYGFEISYPSSWSSPILGANDLDMYFPGDSQAPLWRLTFDNYYSFAEYSKNNKDRILEELFKNNSLKADDLKRFWNTRKEIINDATIVWYSTWGCEEASCVYNDAMIFNSSHLVWLSMWQNEVTPEIEASIKSLKFIK